ncbi:MAG: hypothetical protein WCF90_04390 [Methanomicrobiales archaeon]
MENNRTGTDTTGFNLLILSISLTAFLSTLDETIVNIALPTISSGFHI